jgi:uncharacterized membrane protein
MNYGKFEVGDMLGWFKSGLQLVFRNPAAFIVMGLVFAIISFVLAIIPIIGGIALIVLAPVFYGGVVYAAREEAEGRKAEIGHLFAAFQQPGKVGPMMMLCLPSVAAGIVIVILAFVLIGGSMMAIATGGSGGGGMGFVGILLFALLAFIIGIAAACLVYFAIPRVMLDGVEPITAMKDSLSAIMANAVSFIVGSIVIGIIVVIIAIVPIIGALALALIGLPTGMAAVYYGYRQVFGGASPVAPMPPAPPPVIS